MLSTKEASERLRERGFALDADDVASLASKGAFPGAEKVGPRWQIPEQDVQSYGRRGNWGKIFAYLSLVGVGTIIACIALAFAVPSGLRDLDDLMRAYLYPTPTSSLTFRESRGSGPADSQDDEESSPPSIAIPVDLTMDEDMELGYFAEGQNRESRVLGFTVANANPGGNLFTIDSLWLEIIGSEPCYLTNFVEPAGPMGGPTEAYRYEVSVDAEGRYFLITDDNYEYPPGELDQFMVELKPSEEGRGYIYTARILVYWYDLAQPNVLKRSDLNPYRVEFAHSIRLSRILEVADHIDLFLDDPCAVEAFTGARSSQPICLSGHPRYSGHKARLLVDKLLGKAFDLASAPETDARVFANAEQINLSHYSEGSQYLIVHGVELEGSEPRKALGDGGLVIQDIGYGQAEVIADPVKVQQYVQHFEQLWGGSGEPWELQAAEEDVSPIPATVEVSSTFTTPVTSGEVGIFDFALEDRDGNLVLSDAETGETLRLNLQIGRGAAWSPDGGWIAVNQKGLWLVRARDGVVFRIAPDPYYSIGKISWSPSGSRLAFWAGVASALPPGLQVYGVGTGALQRIPGTEAHACVRDPPAWSHDEEWLTFYAVSCSKPVAWRGLTSIRTDGSDVESVPDAPYGSLHPSPAAHKVVISAYDPAWRGLRLYVAEFTSEPGSVVSIGPDEASLSMGWPKWRPDGDVFYASTFDGQRHDIVAVDAGAQVEILWDRVPVYGNPDWSPNRTRIALGSTDLTVYDLDTKQPEVWPVTSVCGILWGRDDQISAVVACKQLGELKAYEVTIVRAHGIQREALQGLYSGVVAVRPAR